MSLSKHTPAYEWDVFFSYAHTTRDEIEDVRSLAELLSNKGVSVRIDVSLKPGDSIPEFMDSITRSRHVLAFCTPEYKQRSAGSAGGVRYEASILSGSLLEEGDQRNCIPVLLRGKWSEVRPPWLAGRKYIDLRTGAAKGLNSVLLAIRDEESEGIASWSAVFESSAEPLDQEFAIELLKHPVQLDRVDGKLLVTIDRNGTALNKPFILPKDGTRFATRFLLDPRVKMPKNSKKWSTISCWRRKMEPSRSQPETYHFGGRPVVFSLLSSGVEKRGPRSSSEI